MSDPNLVTTCNFNGRNYFIKMHVDNNILELVVTDKQTGEDWQCCYESSYIESITQKTGNYKQFKIFTAMLKSGLLKTSNSVYLDLLTFNDLDALRNHRIRGLYSAYQFSKSNNNRRYLILTYTAEFDRIHYPIPLEYCGPPDPLILQQTINKLEEEIVYLKEHTKGSQSNRSDSKVIRNMQKRIEDLAEENQQLRNETSRLTQLLDNKSNHKNQIVMLQNAIKNLEKSVMSERRSHHELVDKLRKDKLILSQELDRIKHTDKGIISQFNAINSPRFKRASPKHSEIKIRGDSRSPSPKINVQWPPKKDSLTRNRSSIRPRMESRSPSPVNNVPRVSRNQTWKTSISNKQPQTKNRVILRDQGAKGDNHRSPSPSIIYKNKAEAIHPSRSVTRRSTLTKVRKAKNSSDSESSGRELIYKSTSRARTRGTSRSGSMSSRGSSLSSKSKRDATETMPDIEAIMNRLSQTTSPRRNVSKTSDIDRNFSSLENRISYLQKIVDDSLHMTI